MRPIRERALQQPVRPCARWLAAAAGSLLLAGCANEGIWPKEELPPAPAQQLPFPSYQSRETGSEDQRGVLTDIEREELEERLTKMAKSREKSVERRIETPRK